LDSSPSEKPGQESNSSSDSQLSQKPDGFRSVTRLVVGGLAIGLEELFSRLSKWEGETSQQAEAPSKQTGQIYTTLPEQDQAERDESDSQTVRYALVGLVFEAQDAIRERAKSLSKAERAIFRWSDPIIKPVYSNRLIAPARRRFDHFVERGQHEVDRWVNIGRQEETHSKALTLVAINQTVDDTIGSFADNPEIQGLITTQTTGLVEEIVEEVRERSFGVDLFLEGIIRMILRRKPRYQLPTPPIVVQKRAKTLRPVRQVKKIKGTTQLR
jgi:hypothetical protein